MIHAGDHDIAAAAAELADRLPEPLRPLARVAYNYWWSWTTGADEVFAAVDLRRWEACGNNPVRLLTEVRQRELAAAAADPRLVERVAALAAAFDRMRSAPHDGRGVATSERPVAFLCAEFAVHSSLPVYSGGLGVLAGDLLKEASDRRFPMVGVGLLYRTGYFHQRVDTAGMQHEYWNDADPDNLPCVRVTGADGTGLHITVPVDGEELSVAVWRVDVGRVPLYLLDTDVPANSTFGRWVTSRLYEQNREVRLAQYAVLGVGAVRALDALGIDPIVHHVNEGHPVLAATELVARSVAAGSTVDDAWAGVRDRFVFTTHTPVPAGNETYGRDEIAKVLGTVGRATGDWERFLAAGRVHPADGGELSGMTALALRVSRSTNGVSRRHGEVARAMWQPLFGAASPDDVPIGHVTNGVHLPTWIAAPMADLLDRHLVDGWRERADDQDVWAGIDAISDADLWATRCELRRRMVDMVTERATADRLRRGESVSYAEAVDAFDPDRLTIGFARRLATYKRLYLLGLLPERSVALLTGEHPVQFVFAGKAHPADDGAKQIVKALFSLKDRPPVAGQVAFLEDYDLPLAAGLVAGCDVWVNVPRPPLEASGTSGMKATANGGLHLSVADGWWAEGYDGTNGWSIDGGIDPDERGQDLRHANELLDLLEQQVIPMFWERDADGLPTRWLAMVRASLRTNGPRFSASRMLADYARTVYPSSSGSRPAP